MDSVIGWRDDGGSGGGSGGVGAGGGGSSAPNRIVPRDSTGHGSAGGCEPPHRSHLGAEPPAPEPVLCTLSVRAGA